jgi:hypothetical protein
MFTAPRDQQLIVVRLVDSQRYRKFREHIVLWDSSGAHPCWRSQIAASHPIQERSCAGWRPMNDGDYAFLEMQRERRSEQALQAKKAKPK